MIQGLKPVQTKSFYFPTGAAATSIATNRQLARSITVSFVCKPIFKPIFIVGLAGDWRGEKGAETNANNAFARTVLVVRSAHDAAISAACQVKPLYPMVTV